MENNDPENKIYSAGYADTFQGENDISPEYSCFYEKEPDGTVGASNLYVLASGIAGTSFPEVSARFAAKKILYEYFRSEDYVDANRLAAAVRAANNEICEYSKVQADRMGASAIAASVSDGKVAIATVGGSRAYIIRNGKVYQITEDPQVIREKVESGKLSPEEAYGEDGEPPAYAFALGMTPDITTDVYDGIDVRGGDTLLLCSASLDTFIGKEEILSASAAENPRTIVQQLMGSPSIQNAGIPASIAAIRIYDSGTVDSMIRIDGDAPEKTDLNSEKKEIDLILKQRSRGGQTSGGQEKKKDKLPVIILLALLALMLLAGGVWAAARFGLMPDSIREKYLGNLVPSTATPTATIDWVRESMTVYEATAEVDNAIAVFSTVAAWPTQTPYPTYTPVFIDLEESEPTELPTVKPAATESAGAEDETETEEPDPTEGPTATPRPTLAPETETPEADEVREDYTDERSGAEMIYIPAGNFLLGSNPEQDPNAYIDEETPQLRVYLDGYWIGKTEVTNAQYLRCVEAGVCEQGYYMSLYTPGEEDYPVTYVTHDQAERFCSWIGGHLPSEYQWEKAARGTDGRIYPWGDEEPDYDNGVANIPNYYSYNDASDELYPVGSFPKGQSPYGVMDMAGNVWEWTSTWYSTNYYATLEAEAELSESVISNPEGPENGSSFVMRGGSCAPTEINYYTDFMRSANRSYLSQTSSYYVGFRCMVPVDANQTEPGFQEPGPGMPGDFQQPGPGPRP
ncbi:MAG: SUMF1/EgtB/PvdO family nonheme iron enzyme [Anaerolineaceae bacterium]|nr:SUMF1/EgtB/PvdO family nonheme iron enzyme [Anaerolineaceae bacterium]